MTTVWACEKTVVMVKQPGHLTSMKKERGAGTRVCIVRNLDQSFCIETYETDKEQGEFLICSMIISVGTVTRRGQRKSDRVAKVVCSLND